MMLILLVMMMMVMIKSTCSFNPRDFAVTAPEVGRSSIRLCRPSLRGVAAHKDRWRVLLGSKRLDADGL